MGGRRRRLWQGRCRCLAPSGCLTARSVCPLTSKLHPRWRSRIPVRCAGRKAEIAVDQIRTISKSRLVERVDELKPADAASVRRLIVEMYGE